MPTIKERMNKLVGFEAAESPQPVSPMSRPTMGPNPYIRCPIPPINTGTDTLRQFDESGNIPTRRVLPLPIATVAGGNTVVNQTSTSSASGSSSSSSTVATLTATSVTINVPALTVSGAYRASVSVAKALQLIQVVASAPVEVRLYGSSITQGGDASRLTDTPPAFETQAGLVTDIVFDSAPYNWTWQNRVVANADSPQTSNLYITVVNPSSLLGLSASTVTIQYLLLEA